MSTADGSWVGGDDWKARVDASVTTNNADKAVITVKCICVSDYGTTAGYNNLQGGTAYGNNSYNWGSATSISTDQTKQMASKTYTITKTHSTQSIKCWAKVKGISGIYDGSSSEASVNVTVSAKTSYTVSYNANGGTGSMANSQKWYGESLTLRSNTFTRTGYTFKGWATSASGGVSYANGAAYTGNAALTLYAVWQANTWAVSYNANGGSGAPASQTKTYGQTLTLRSEIPTLANHEFVEWNTAANGSGTSYAPGGSYTTNGAVTLYAQWRMAYNLPTIENLEVVRYDQTSGQDSDEGTDMRVSFDWTVDTTSLPDTNNDISTTNTYVEYRQKGSSGSWTRLALTIDTTNKTASVITNTGLFDQASSYDVYVVVADTHGTTRSITTILSTTTYIFDVAAGGQGMSIGKPIAPDGTGLQVAWDAAFDGNVTIAGCLVITNTNDANPTADNGPALIIGPRDGVHIEIDQNEILAKASATTGSPLYVGDPAGGKATQIGGAPVAFNSVGAITANNWILQNNNLGYRIKNASGAEWNAVTLNNSNQYTFGNGGYSASTGDSFFDGNWVRIRTKNKVTINGKAPIKYTTHTQAMGNVSASSGYSVSGTATAQSGYTPIGIIGHNMTHNQAGAVGGCLINVSNRNVRAYGSNWGGNWTGTNNFQWDILWVANELL